MTDEQVDAHLEAWANLTDEQLREVERLKADLAQADADTETAMGIITRLDAVVERLTDDRDNWKAAAQQLLTERDNWKAAAQAEIKKRHGETEPEIQRLRAALEAIRYHWQQSASEMRRMAADALAGKRV